MYPFASLVMSAIRGASQSPILGTGLMSAIRGRGMMSGGGDLGVGDGGGGGGGIGGGGEGRGGGGGGGGGGDCVNNSIALKSLSELTTNRPSVKNAAADKPRQRPM